MRLQVLGVLAQRYPGEVESALGKLRRATSKKKAASAAASLALAVNEEDAWAGDGGNDDDGGCVVAASRDAFHEESLSSLIASTFVGVELAHHVPFQVGLRLGIILGISIFFFQIEEPRLGEGMYVTRKLA